MRYDCIIVLANRMDKHGNLNDESTARVDLAVESFKNDLSEIIIFCGWDYRKDSDIYIADAMKALAINLGISENNILTDISSRDTVGDAFFTKQNLVKPNNWKTLLVITSDYHVNRASRIFQFIYGNGYSIEVAGACCFDNAEKQFSEQASLDAFTKTVGNIAPGDDVEIFNALKTRHPFYNGTTYS